MKKTFSSLFLILAVIFFCGAKMPVNATIVMGTVNNLTPYQGSLDLNNDGTADFYFQSSTAYPDIDCYNCVLRYTWNDVNNIWTQGNMGDGNWDKVYGLPAGTSIGSNGNWESQGDAALVDMSYGTPNVALNQDIYVGLRIKAGNYAHYGWAKVRLTGSETTGYTAEWIECAYESTPNTAIAAGDKGSGVVENSAARVNVYPNPTTDFVTVVAARISDLAVYDSNGRRVNVEARLGNDMAILDMRALTVGTYFVCVDGVPVKVVRR